MPRHATILAFALTCLLAAALSAEPAADTSSTTAGGAVTEAPAALAWPELLAAQRHELRLEDGRLTGDGAELLVREALQSRYVLIGEDHGVAEVPAITGALAERLRPSFATYVTEVGPWSAGRLTELARSDAAAAAFDAHYAAHPFSIPFAFYRPEAELLSSFAAGDVTEPIWGIDQEFFLAPQLCFHHLATRAEGAIAGRLRSWADAERDAFATIIQQGNPNVPTFMNSPLPQDWPEVRRHFESRDDDEALALVDDLERSRRIYQHVFSGRGQANNQERSELMKANLRGYFERHGRDRRLLVKLGANHVSRGWSSLGISDVGNFLAEVAALDGERSLHVLILATGGARNGWLPFLPPSALETPIDLESPAYEALAPLGRRLPEPKGWAVYDLRPLRAELPRWRGGPATVEERRLDDLVLGFDLVVTLDRATPAALFPSLLPNRGDG